MSDPMAGLDVPNLEDSTVDRLTAVRAACQVIGPPNEAKEVKEIAWQFEAWLKEATDHADRVVRRWVLMTINQHRAQTTGAERDPGKLRRIADELYRYVL